MADRDIISPVGRPPPRARGQAGETAAAQSRRTSAGTSGSEATGVSRQHIARTSASGSSSGSPVNSARSSPSAPLNRSTASAADTVSRGWAADVGGGTSIGMAGRRIVLRTQCAQLSCCPTACPITQGTAMSNIVNRWQMLKHSSCLVSLSLPLIHTLSVEGFCIRCPWAVAHMHVAPIMQTVVPHAGMHAAGQLQMG
jgi:hypothetical protein